MEPILSPECRKLVESIDGLGLESFRTHYYFVREDVYELKWTPSLGQDRSGIKRESRCSCR